MYQNLKQTDQFMVQYLDLVIKVCKVNEHEAEMKKLILIIIN